MIDLLGPSLEETIAVNPAFAAAGEAVRAAFIDCLEVENLSKRVVYDRDAGPMDRLYLFGIHSAVLLEWEDAGYKTTSTGYYADTLGAQFVAPESAPRLPRSLRRATSMAEGIAWSLPFSKLPDLRQKVGQEAYDSLLLALIKGEWLSAAPMLQRTLNLDRVAMGSMMELRQVKAGEVLVDSHGEFSGLYALLPGLTARVERTRADGVPVAYTMGIGSIFAHRPGDRDEGKGHQTVAAAVDGWVLYLRRRTLLLISLNPFSTARGELESLLDELHQRTMAADDTVAALKHSPLFRDIPDSQLYPLLQATVPSRWRPRFNAPAPIGDQGGVAAVLRGELLSYRLTAPSRQVEFASGGPRLHTLAHYGQLDVIGDRDMVLGYDFASHWMARVPSHTMFITRQSINDSIGDDPVYKAAVVGVASEAQRDDRMVATRKEAGRHRAHAILVGTADGSAWTPGLDAVLSASMFAILEDFDEGSRAVELRPRTGAKASARAGEDRIGWEVVYVDLKADEGATAEEVARVVTAKAVELGTRQKVSNMFVRVDAGLPSVPTLAAAFDRVVFFERDIHAIERRPLPAGVPLTFVAFLPETNLACQGAWYPPSTVRLRIELAAIEEKAGNDRAWAWDGAAVVNSFATVHPVDDGMERDFRKQMSRLGRGLTDRRVGLALSGGESWGFGHYAVLGMLLYRNIPIDLIAGASVGSVIGGYFCIQGVEGLKSFISDRGKVMAISMASMGTSTLFMGYLDRAFGGSLLEGLDRQLIPVATNLQMSCPEPILAGKVAWGCRMSGSLVPAYASTPTEKATFLDGAFSDNLPVDALRVEGARLVIGSNVMSPSASIKPYPPLLPGLAGRVISDFNLVRRLSASYQGVLTLAYTAGGASANNADRSFQFERVGIGLFNLLDSPEIVHRALSQPDLRETLLGVQLRWEQLRRPRTDSDGTALVEDC